MAKILNIVERAYQGTLEEQDDQALWLIHALKNAGGDHAVLLRGPAVSYAVPNQRVSGLEVGGVKAGNPPRLDEDVKKLVGKGVEVYAVREDAAQRGIEPEDTLREVKWVSRAEVAKLLVDAARVLAW